MIAESTEYPGWLTFDIDAPERFNSRVMGRLIMRREADRFCRLRCFPAPHLGNVLGAVHGGATLALIDISLFAALHLLGQGDPRRSVTLDLSNQFIGPGRLDQPLDAVVELLRETGRLAFLRGTVEQEAGLVAAFSGTIRKPSPQP